MANQHHMKLTLPWRHGGVSYVPGDKVRVPAYVRDRMLREGAATSVYGRQATEKAAEADAGQPTPAAESAHDSGTSDSEDDEEPDPAGSPGESSGEDPDGPGWGEKLAEQGAANLKSLGSDLSQP